jgi:hypothetical protein
VRGGQLFEGGYAEGLLNLPGCEIAEPDVEDIPPAAYARPEGFLQIASVVNLCSPETGGRTFLSDRWGSMLGGDYHFGMVSSIVSEVPFWYTFAQSNALIPASRQSSNIPFDSPKSASPPKLGTETQ